MGIEEKLRASIEVVLDDFVGAGRWRRRRCAEPRSRSSAPSEPSMAISRPMSRWRSPSARDDLRVSWRLRSLSGFVVQAWSTRPMWQGRLSQREVRAGGVPGNRCRSARCGPSYGRAPAATGERVLIEFVSANPTGRFSSRTAAARCSAMRSRGCSKPRVIASRASTTSTISATRCVCWRHRSCRRAR